MSAGQLICEGLKAGFYAICAAAAIAIVLWILGIVSEDCKKWIEDNILFPIFRGDPVLTRPISTSIRGCVTGQVTRLLTPSGQDISIRLSGGAERTHICDDNPQFKAKEKDFAKHIHFSYPSCFLTPMSIVVEGAIAEILKLDTKSPAVCRAKYRVVDWAIEATSYEQGINICLGQRGKNQPTWRQEMQQEQRLRECSDEELRANGFFGQ